MWGATVAKPHRRVTGRHRTSSPEAMTTKSLSTASFDSASDSPRHRPREVIDAIRGRVPVVLGHRANRGDAM